MAEIVHLSDHIPRPLAEDQLGNLRTLYSNCWLCDAIILLPELKIKLHFSEVKGELDISEAIKFVPNTLMRQLVKKGD
jgi:hypothetical protein